MKITYLELYKYKRFPLLGKDKLVLNIASKLNLILGCNGAGKSSLVSELSPLPANKDDFYEGGYKIITIEHNGSVYTLTSDIANNEYSFIVADEELNPSKLISIQRELVYQHFLLNQDIWDILTGKVNFTDMTLINRKKLFNTLSHLNVESILNIHSENKELHKQQQALLKTQSNLYTIENNKLLDLTLLDTLQARLTRNNEAMAALLEVRTMLVPYVSDIPLGRDITTYKDIKTTIAQITTNNWMILTSYPHALHSSTKATIVGKIELCNQRLKDLYTSIETLQTKLKAIELKKKSSKLSIETNIETLQSLVINHAKNLVFLSDMTVGTHSDLHALYYSLSDIVAEMPLNTDKLYSRANYDRSLANKNTLLTQKQQLYQQQLYLTKEVDMLCKQKQDDSVTCPNCHHTWSQHYDPLKHASLVEKKLEVDNKLAEIEQCLVTENTYLEAFSEYMSKYRVYANIRTSYLGKFPELFEVIDKREYIFLEPRSILTVINTAIDDMNSLLEIVKHKQTLTQLISDLQLVSNTDTEDEASVRLELSDITEKVTELLYEKEIEYNKLQCNDTSFALYNQILLLEQSLADTVNAIHGSNLSYTVRSVITSIDFELNSLKMQGNDLQNQLSNHNNLTAVVAKYQQDINETTANIEVLKLIVDELNPKSGIIGKIISNYLNGLIEYINKIISSLWNYKMELIPYNLETDALDYRFKINVEDKLSVKDVSLASSGMKEIVNLSFKLAMTKLLGLTDFPLYLDEFGARLDSEHKSNIYNLIFKFLNDDNYSQIYLITHTDLSYSNFKDTDIIRLS
jgi:predicted ATPase